MLTGTTSTLFQVVFVSVWLVLFVCAFASIQKMRSRNRRVVGSLGPTPPLLTLMVGVRYRNWGTGYISLKGVRGSFVELTIWPNCIRLGLPESHMRWLAPMGVGFERYLPTAGLVVSNFQSQGFEGWLHLEGHAEGKHETFAVTAGGSRFAVITALSEAGAQLALGS